MDALTRLADRREFSAWLAEREDAEQISVVLFDVDDVRGLNERHGYEQIDDLLARFGALIKDRCGGRDIAARIGGDEFAFGLLTDDQDETIHEIEHIRRGFRELSPGGTLSVGVSDSATLRGTNLSLLQAAYDALVDAKQEGPEGFAVFRRHYR
jgi:diguanylate cyclase (GGDEF)-like protein